MAKAKLFRGTIKGTAYWAHIKETEKYQNTDTGKYTIQLVADDKDKNRLLKEVQKVWMDYSETIDKKVNPANMVTGIKEYKDEEFIKFSLNAHIKTKAGEEFDLTVPVFDASCKPITNIPAIGNGSIVNVAYEISPYFMNTKNFGVSLRLKGIQIIDLVEYGESDASSMGFEAVAGYKDSDEDSNDNPFDEDDSSVADGDF